MTPLLLYIGSMPVVQDNAALRHQSGAPATRRSHSMTSLRSSPTGDPQGRVCGVASTVGLCPHGRPPPLSITCLEVHL
ncbi:hypothetical protein HMPREF9057_01349 [Actinomyces sp. oral taxon 171 str. F0337]|nr:hypothetical protein HMPREF9057_01349 [Actinomyces sp. oral taxon 171 str. F0337]